MVLQTFACRETSRERPSWSEEGILSEARAGVWPAGGTHPGAREARAGAPGRALQEPVGAERGLESAGGREVGCPRARVCGRRLEVHAAPLAGRGAGRSEALGVPVRMCRGPASTAEWGRGRCAAQDGGALPGGPKRGGFENLSVERPRSPPGEEGGNGAAAGQRKGAEPSARALRPPCPPGSPRATRPGRWLRVDRRWHGSGVLTWGHSDVRIQALLLTPEGSCGLPCRGLVLLPETGGVGGWGRSSTSLGSRPEGITGGRAPKSTTTHRSFICALLYIKQKNSPNPLLSFCSI